MSLQPITMIGFDNRGGLQTNKKPAFIPEVAFQNLNNAYAWRDRVKKREGLRLVGRLNRNLTAQSLGTTPAGPPATVTITNIFATLGITGENPQLIPGFLVITVGAPDTATFTDNGNGTFAVTGAGVAAGSFINYVTGEVVLQFTALVGGAAITANLSYTPGLPVMGIDTRDIASINAQQTIFFDTKYSYIYVGNQNLTSGANFAEFIPGTTWAGTNSDFFWTTNYRGIEPQDRLFFVTNFVNDAADPMRYTDGATWTTFAPTVAANQATKTSIGSIADNGSTFSGTILGAPIEPGSVTITVEGITFTDSTGSGTLTGNPNTNTGTINYTTGAVTLSFTPVIKFTAPITNITTAANAVVTSVAHHLTTGAQVTITGVVGTMAPEVNDKSFTITVTDADHFELNATTVGAYTSGGEWTLTEFSQTVFASFQTGAAFLFQARVLIPYFGRLLALNIWEGATIGSAANIFNRCRFSQLGSPVASDAWRSDIFGKGGFVDAPTNESIVSATFLNNTLIVFFERTTWQLRYVGEYGLPFIWERIASDLGSESTFSPILFNDNILAIGDRAIISANQNAVNRIDLEIPDEIFQFQNANNGFERIQGIRDYQKELVYWCFPSAQSEAAPGVTTTFPNAILVYNYRNNTWATYTENVTAFGTLQFSNNITWDSTTVTWDDEDVTWDDFDSQSNFPTVVSGNSEGFIHQFGYTTPTEASLSISAISYTAPILTLTITNHNLSDGDLIYLTGMMFLNATTFVPITTSLNNTIYRVTVIDANNVSIAIWNFVTDSYEFDFVFTPTALTNALYIGGGQAAFLIIPEIKTKDFNPYQTAGLQMKISYIDFLLDTTTAPPSGIITGATQANPCVITSTAHGLQSGQEVTILGVKGMTQLNVGQFYTITVLDVNTFSLNVNSTNFGAYTSSGTWTMVLGDVNVSIFLNSSPGIFGNLVIGNTTVSAYGVQPFYGEDCEYQWHRFYATAAAQYMNFLFTYTENLANVYATHEKELIINGVIIWTRKGGKIVF